MTSRARVALGVAVGGMVGSIVLAGLAYWVLISPGNPFTRLFRRPIAITGARVMVGPYPLPEDFHSLVDAGVTTIVSLLDPDIPYEGALLERERELADRHGLRLEVFPMSSILGRRFGADYDRNAERAVEAIRAAPGRVYLHCYLGLHRIEAVLARIGEKADVALARRPRERSEDARRLDRAEAEYAEGRFAEARSLVAAIESPTRDSLLLDAWSAYRLSLVEEARSLFARAVDADPMDAGALAGLAYCDLQQGHVERAERGFAAAIAADERNADAHFGRALALRRLGRPEDARAAARAALALNPAYEDARRLLEELSAPAPGVPSPSP